VESQEEADDRFAAVGVPECGPTLLCLMRGTGNHRPGVIAGGMRAFPVVAAVAGCHQGRAGDGRSSV